MYRARPAEALADPRAFLQRAAALASVEVAGDEAGLVAPEAGAAPRIVAVTACPTGVAHTFMAAEALQLAAGQLGFALQVETQGSVGARNPLDPADIAAADVVLLAADIDVDTARFAGKKIYRCGTGVALKQARATLERALAEGQVESAGAASAVVARDEKRGVYKHLLTGVSFMLPMVVAGGLLIALSLAFGIDAYKQPGSLAAVLRTVGDTAFVLMVPMLAGYIAYSIADRPGLAPGMLGGLLAGTLGAGFIGGIVAGFIAGYAARAISHGLRLPASLEALKPILVIPLLASLVTGLLMLYVVGKPVAGMLAALTGFLDGMGTSNAILLGLLLGGMMCVDLGGPVNKAAYAFSVGLLVAQLRADGGGDGGGHGAADRHGPGDPAGAAQVRRERAAGRQGSLGAGAVLHLRRRDPVRRQGPVAGDPGEHRRRRADRRPVDVFRLQVAGASRRVVRDAGAQRDQPRPGVPAGDRRRQPAYRAALRRAQARRRARTGVGDLVLAGAGGWRIAARRSCALRHLSDVAGVGRITPQALSADTRRTGG